MRINDKYSVERLDTYNIGIIEHKVKGKDSKLAGEQYTEVIGYYSTYEGAFNKLIALSVDDSSLTAMLDSLNSAKKEILEAINVQGCK